MVATQALKRVERLEAATGGGGKCPECGAGADWSKIPRVVKWVDHGEQVSPEWCGTCGRPLRIVVTFPDWPGPGRAA